MITKEQVFTQEQITEMTGTQNNFVDYIIKKANDAGMPLRVLERKLFWYRGRFMFEGPAIRVSGYSYNKIFNRLRKKGLASKSDNCGFQMLIY